MAEIIRWLFFGRQNNNQEFFKRKGIHPFSKHVKKIKMDNSTSNATLSNPLCFLSPDSAYLMLIARYVIVGTLSVSRSVPANQKVLTRLRYLFGNF